MQQYLEGWRHVTIGNGWVIQCWMSESEARRKEVELSQSPLVRIIDYLILEIWFFSIFWAKNLMFVTNLGNSEFRTDFWGQQEIKRGSQNGQKSVKSFSFLLEEYFKFECFKSIFKIFLPTQPLRFRFFMYLNSSILSF